MISIRIFNCTSLLCFVFGLALSSTARAELPSLTEEVTVTVKGEWSHTHFSVEKAEKHLRDTPYSSAKVPAAKAAQRLGGILKSYKIISVEHKIKEGKGWTAVRARAVVEAVIAPRTKRTPRKKNQNPTFDLTQQTPLEMLEQQLREEAHNDLLNKILDLDVQRNALMTLVSRLSGSGVLRGVVSGGKKVNRYLSRLNDIGERIKQAQGLLNNNNQQTYKAIDEVFYQMQREVESLPDALDIDRSFVKDGTPERQVWDAFNTFRDSLGKAKKQASGNIVRPFALEAWAKHAARKSQNTVQRPTQPSPIPPNPAPPNPARPQLNQQAATPAASKPLAEQQSEDTADVSSSQSYAAATKTGLSSVAKPSDLDALFKRGGSGEPNHSSSSSGALFKPNAASQPQSLFTKQGHSSLFKPHNTQGVTVDAEQLSSTFDRLREDKKIEEENQQLEEQSLAVTQSQIDLIRHQKTSLNETIRQYKSQAIKRYISIVLNSNESYLYSRSHCCKNCICLPGSYSYIGRHVYVTWPMEVMVDERELRAYKDQLQTWVYEEFRSLFKSLKASLAINFSSLSLSVVISEEYGLPSNTKDEMGWEHTYERDIDARFSMSNAPKPPMLSLLEEELKHLEEELKHLQD